MQNRVARAQTLHDTRDWVQERRALTRQFVELDGLVQKAGPIELLHDDRAALLGAMMELADQLRGARDGVDDRPIPATRRRLAAPRSARLRDGYGGQRYLKARFGSQGAGSLLRFGWTARCSMRRIMARVTMASDTSGRCS
jgi:hypothetical protein